MPAFPSHVRDNPSRYQGDMLGTAASANTQNGTFPIGCFYKKQ